MFPFGRYSPLNWDNTQTFLAATDPSIGIIKRKQFLAATEPALKQIKQTPDTESYRPIS